MEAHNCGRAGVHRRPRARNRLGEVRNAREDSGPGYRPSPRPLPTPDPAPRRTVHDAVIRHGGEIQKPDFGAARDTRGLREMSDPPGGGREVGKAARHVCPRRSIDRRRAIIERGINATSTPPSIRSARIIGSWRIIKFMDLLSRICP